MNEPTPATTLSDLSGYTSASGTLEPVWTLEIQTVPADVERILDAVMTVTPLLYGNYERNASISAVGVETAQPRAGSTTDAHVDGFDPGGTETYPIVEVKISIHRDRDLLARVMDAVLDVHHYEEPVIFVRDAWASRSAYDPNNNNLNRWWNNGRGLPGKVDLAEFLAALGPID